MTRVGGSPVLLVAAALLVLTPAAESYGYRRLGSMARQRFSGGAGRQRLLSGLARHAAAVADSLRLESRQNVSSGGGEEYGAPLLAGPPLLAAAPDPNPPEQDSLLPRRRLELKRFLRRQQHHKKMMSKNKRLNGKNEICLFKALRRCGNHLIKELSSDQDFDHRCSSKEDFLDCMSRMQHGRCHVKHVRHGPSRALVQQYQQRLRRLLKATRGCVIGVDLSTDAD